MTRNSSHTKRAENLINILVKYAVVGTSNHKKSSVNNACSTIKHSLIIFGTFYVLNPELGYCKVNM